MARYLQRLRRRGDPRTRMRMAMNARKPERGKAGAQRRRSAIKFALVGFFDLLGFSDRVEPIKTEADLLKVAKAVDRIRTRFEYRSKDKWVKDLHRTFDKTVLAFSDCIVTSASLETKMVRTEGLFDMLGGEIWDIANSQCSCVLEGDFLRGGVAFGRWYYHKGLLVSPAMVGAYNEEHHRACYPVIAVSNDLYSLLRHDRGRKAYSKDTDPFRDQFASFIHPSTGERVRFVNYLRLVAASLDWKYDKATFDAYLAAPRHSEERDRIMFDGYIRTLAQFFECHKAVITSAYRAAKGNVKQKYQFLAEYHDRELRRFLPRRNDIRVIL